jgi:hypothetical protein
MESDQMMPVFSGLLVNQREILAAQKDLMNGLAN